MLKSKKFLIFIYLFFFTEKLSFSMVDSTISLKSIQTKKTLNLNKKTDNNTSKIVKIIKNIICPCLNQFVINEIIDSNDEKSILENKILFNLISQFLNQEDLLKLRCINNNLRINVYIYSKNFNPIRFKEEINPINVNNFLNWLYTCYKKTSFCLDITLSDCGVKPSDSISTENFTEIFNLLEENIVKLDLFCLDGKTINLELLKKSYLKELCIKNCNNIDDLFSKHYFPQNLENLKIIEQCLDDKHLEFLPTNLKILDLSLSKGPSGKFLKNQLNNLQKLKLGINTDINFMQELPISLISLCLKNTRIKCFIFLWRLENLLKLCVNNKFSSRDMLFLPENIETIYIDNKNFQNKNHKEIISNLHFKNLQLFKKSLKYLKLYNLNSINPIHFDKSKTSISTIFIKDESYETENNIEHQKKVDFLKTIGFKVKNFSGINYPENKITIHYNTKINENI